MIHPQGLIVNPDLNEAGKYFEEVENCLRGVTWKSVGLCCGFEMFPIVNLM